MNEIIHYLTPDGQDLYQNWLDRVRDRVAKARITTRVNRVAVGAFGDCKPVGDGVWELRVDHGPLPRVLRAGRQAVGTIADGR